MQPIPYSGQNHPIFARKIIGGCALGLGSLLGHMVGLNWCVGRTRSQFALILNVFALQQSWEIRSRIVTVLRFFIRPLVLTVAFSILPQYYSNSRRRCYITSSAQNGPCLSKPVGLTTWNPHLKSHPKPF